MIVASGAGLSMSYGAEDIFQDLSFEIQERERIALVGVNGSGKSTLLRLLARQEQPEHGAITIGSGVRVGYLPQEVTFPAGRTLREQVLLAFSRVVELEAELRRVEAQLAETTEHSAQTDALLDRHTRLMHEFEVGGGYTYHNRMAEVLAGLGIEESRLDQEVATFSGGQRTRVALAELLLGDDNLLLLDEPTNHLDLAATEWLEDYLIQVRAAVLVVSHDRYFLDRVATRTWEMTFGRLDSYNGNYSKFAAQRAERRTRQEKEYEAQQAYVARTEAFIRRYRAGQRYRMARGRQKQLDRMERLTRDRDPARLKLTIRSTLRSGEMVLAGEDLAIAPNTPKPPAQRVSAGAPIVREASRRWSPEEGEVLFRASDMELLRGERVAMVGPNGSGKTTFLRAVVGELEPAEGRIFIGYGVQVSYYAQAHEQLSPEKTVIGEILTSKPMGQEEARTYLGRFLFTGDDVFKRVSALSGGERSRLALAKLALQNANFLILDEPTNHLDIYAREALEDVLSEFGGTILFVSHDRYLIEGLATQVWEVADGRLRVHPGGWAEYLEQRQRDRDAKIEAAAAARAAAAAADPRQIAAREAKQQAQELAARRKQLDRVEEQLTALHQRLQALDEALTQASERADTKRIGDLGREHEAVAADLARCEEEWLALHESVEEAEVAQA